MSVRNNYLTTDGVHLYGSARRSGDGCRNPQIEKAGESWMDIPEECSITGNAPLTIRQYNELSAISAQQQMPLSDFLNREFSKTINSLLKLPVKEDAFPGVRTSYHGFDRYDFTVDGCNAIVIVPKKAVLEGLSRGGLYVYNWAAANQGKVGCIFGDAPVCDFKSWPGGKGKSKGSNADWKSILKCYHFASEQEALDYKGNPVDNLKPLAEAKIPIIHIYGDADTVVRGKRILFLSRNAMRSWAAK